MTKTDKTPPKIHACSLEHYDRYRLRGPSGAIIGVGSKADISRMVFKGHGDNIEKFASATK